MKLAQPNDKTRVVDVLSATFVDNKSVNYILAADYRESRIRHLMGYAFEICFMFGRVYLADDEKACALLLFPDTKKVKLKAIALDVALIFAAIGLTNILKTLRRENKIKAIQPRERMAYLWFIGVDPNFQYGGIGKKLMNELITQMEKENRPLYLETSTAENLPWYKKFDFETYHTLNLGYTLFFLRRKLTTS